MYLIVPINSRRYTYSHGGCVLRFMSFTCTFHNYIYLKAKEHADDSLRMSFEKDIVLV